MTPESEIIDWPTDEGIWMGDIPSIGWFPMKVKVLKKYPEGEAHMPMPFVAQFIESKTSWPFTFQGCHPAKSWRKPNADELRRAQIFYGEIPTDPAKSS